VGAHICQNGNQITPDTSSGNAHYLPASEGAHVVGVAIERIGSITVMIAIDVRFEVSI
jgi:hypothetical protein